MQSSLQFGGVGSGQGFRNKKHMKPIRQLTMLFWKYKRKCQELYFLKDIKISLQNPKSTVSSRKLKWAQWKSQISFWGKNPAHK